MDDDALRDWARGQLETIERDIDMIVASEPERQLVAQFLLARQAR
jgi:hypothetical protein